VTFNAVAQIWVTVGGATDSFSPQNVTVVQNGTVVWTWASNIAPHNVTFSTAGAPANIPDYTSGIAVSRTFPTTGTFSYSCTDHVGMTGSVTVTP
jgi:plastocyanin